MNLLFEKLVSFFLNLQFWFVVFPNEGCVHLRGGKHKRTVKAGFYFKIPIYDNYLKVNVKEQVINLPNQSVTASDGKVLALSGTIKYEISDVRKAILEVLNFDASLQNLAMSLVAEFTRVNDYNAIISCVYEELAEQAEDWGIEVLAFWLTDYAEHKVYRLMGNDAPVLINDL